MKGIGKAITAGAVIIIIGVLIIVITLALNGWSVSANWESKTYEAESDVTALTLDFSTGDISFEFYDGDKIKVEYPYSEKHKTEVSVTDGTMKIVTAERRWYDIDLWFSTPPKATVYIPEECVLDLDLEFNAGMLGVKSGTYGNIKSKVNAGTATFGDIKCTSFENTLNAGTVNFGNIECDNFFNKINAGTVNAGYVVCNKFENQMNAGTAHFGNVDSKDIFVKLNAGTTTIKVAGEEEDFTVSVEKNAGSCNISDRTGGSKIITAKINAGSLSVTFTED